MTAEQVWIECPECCGSGVTPAGWETDEEECPRCTGGGGWYE